MDFVNSLQLIFEDINFDENIQEKIIFLEEELAKNENLEFDISEKEILIYNKKFFDDEKISFKDYIQEWSLLKNFLLENNLATNYNYKQFFKIKKLNFSKNWESLDLDKYIAKVDKNDEKLLEVEKFLKNLKK